MIIRHTSNCEQVAAITQKLQQRDDEIIEHQKKVIDLYEQLYKDSDIKTIRADTALNSKLTSENHIFVLILRI